MHAVGMQNERNPSVWSDAGARDARSSAKFAHPRVAAGMYENSEPNSEYIQNRMTQMIKPIVKDIFFLGQKSEPASKKDLPVGQDLMDTLQANQERCVGMAANMIGVKKKIIIVNMGIVNVVMYNPVIVKKDTPYETEEGCLSLTGTRKTTRYQNIEVEYLDGSWKKKRQKYSGWTAQIIQHECDHLEGIII